MSRLPLLIRRFLRARRLGFLFIGTRWSRQPERVRFRGRQLAIKYSSDPGHLSDVINIWLDDEYGLEVMEGLPKTILDVGGNIGLFSLWAWQNFPDSHIFVFEPNREVFSCLVNNVSGLPVTARLAALGASSGFASMPKAASSRETVAVRNSSGDIPMISLNEAVGLAGGSVDLLKLDCEGAEWEILQDLKAFDAIGSIRMEYHLTGGKTTGDLEAFAARAGYRVSHVIQHEYHGIAWLDRAR